MKYQHPQLLVVGSAIDLVLQDGLGGKAGSGGDSPTSSFNCYLSDIDE